LHAFCLTCVERKPAKPSGPVPVVPNSAIKPPAAPAPPRVKPPAPSVKTAAGTLAGRPPMVTTPSGKVMAVDPRNQFGGVAPPGAKAPAVVKQAASAPLPAAARPSDIGVTKVYE